MKRFLLIFVLIAFIITFNRGSSSMAAEKIPFKARWVSVLKKGKLFKYKRKEFSSPVLFEEGLYVGSDTGYFYRFDKDGDKVWRIKAGSSVNSRPLAWRDRDTVKVAFGDDEGILRVVDAKDGKEIWSVNLGSEIWSAPAISNFGKGGSRLFVTTMEGKIAALNLDDGHMLWEKDYTFPKPISEFGDMAIRGTSEPVVDESRVYVGFSDGAFWALSQNDGKVFWEKNLATQKGFNDMDAPVLLDGDRLYASGFQGNLTAFSRKDGKALWMKEIGTATRLLIVEENGEKSLFASGTDGLLYKLDPKTGMEIWKTVTMGKGAFTAPVSYKGVVVVGLSEGPLSFVNAQTGRLIAHRFAKKGVSSDLVVEDDKIYYLSNGGRLYSLRFKIK